MLGSLTCILRIFDWIKKIPGGANSIKKHFPF